MLSERCFSSGNPLGVAPNRLTDNGRINRVVLVGLTAIVVLGLLTPPLPQPAVMTVVPVDWSRFATPASADEALTGFGMFTANACRYGMTTWYERIRGYHRLRGRFVHPPKLVKDEVQPLGAFAETCSIALVTGAYEQARRSASSDERWPRLDEVRARTIRLLTSVAHSNRANGGFWGGSRVGPHGTDSTNAAAPVMLAAWLLWPDLSTDDQALVTNMARYEVERLMKVPVRYYRDRRERILTPGDTGAEELVWNTTFLSLMVNMLPGHPDQPAWERRLARSTLAAWARPSDVERTMLFHGRPLASWIDGSNLNEDGTLANGKIDPNPYYMTAAANGAFQVVAFALSDRDPLAAATFNLDAVYRALVEREFRVEEGFMPPGGTIYVPGSPEIYYPSGHRKQTNVYVAFAFLDAVTSQFHADRGIEPRASIWEERHLGRALEMQQRFDDGRSNASEAEGGTTHEFWVAYWAARAHLFEWLASRAGFELVERPL